MVRVVRVRRAVRPGLGEAAGAIRLPCPGRQMAVERLIARREVHLWVKTLWWMLYETAGRAQDILGANIDEVRDAEPDRGCDLLCWM